MHTQYTILVLLFKIFSKYKRSADSSFAMYYLFTVRLAEMCRSEFDVYFYRSSFFFHLLSSYSTKYFQFWKSSNSQYAFLSDFVNSIYFKGILGFVLRSLQNLTSCCCAALNADVVNLLCVSTSTCHKKPYKIFKSFLMVKTFSGRIK